ncbi:benzoate 4-monooxygenase cytochrome P450 [Microsporum canis CBS 113480]|uniref:Benzoate 4-monooxygenase cytochrome P450 n=1 Tax=Arthroderma otae (strain ATCC MYA-4605 / CBS 113480) TaxID=554155 RepID=C5FEY6_ARTOC|nr:benzoate 4-monooxygenase cytochrome P450 [Microsporum canis CBS 113480]EEQ28280.1 benzoate 4-monooxygenase cytochrome P450 [Microsporum canis CBS 113480]
MESVKSITLPTERPALQKISLEQSYLKIGLLLALITTVFFVTRAVYRLLFHPLSGFPGPKLAAISHLYEFYYDVIRGGTYIKKIDLMHQRYGPIIRINPRELHIKDSHYYERIYAGYPHRRDKDPSSTAIFTTPLPMVATVHHEHHRLRRSFLNNFFSKRSIKEMEPCIQAKANRLISVFRTAYKSGTVLELHRVMSALTADVVTTCCFGASHSYLDQKTFENQMIDAVNYVLSMCHINKFLPLIPKLLRLVPQRLLRNMGVYMADVITVTHLIRQQALESLCKTKVTDNTDADAPLASTIFDALAATNVPKQEKSAYRLEDEAAAIFGAGTETTSRALSVALFFLLSERPLMLKLREELEAHFPSSGIQPSSTQLEKLPYLTPVSQSTYFVHMDPDIFPHPESFNPERWVEASKQGQYLNRFLVAFGKGSRQCLGINLAYTELYLILATVVCSVDMKLVETTVENIQMGRDLGHPAPKKGGFAVKVMVTGIRDI